MYAQRFSSSVPWSLVTRLASFPGRSDTSRHFQSAEGRFYPPHLRSLEKDRAISATSENHSCCVSHHTEEGKKTKKSEAVVWRVHDQRVSSLFESSASSASLLRQRYASSDEPRTAFVSQSTPRRTIALLSFILRRLDPAFHSQLFLLTLRHYDAKRKQERTTALRHRHS